MGDPGVTPLDLAGELAWELYSNAEFVARCAQAAKEALRNGDAARAREELAQAEQHAGLVESEFRHALRAIEQAT